MKKKIKNEKIQQKKNNKSIKKKINIKYKINQNKK